MSRDIAFQKGLPANLEAERLTLGAVLIEGDSFGLIGSELAADDFSLDSHKRIFNRMTAIYERGEKIDRVALANELMRHSELESVGGLSYLMELDEGTPRSLNVTGYMGIVKEKAALRGGIFACQALMDAMFMQVRPANELLGQAAALQEILSRKDDATESIGQVFDRVGFDGILGPASNDGGVMLPWAGLAEIVPFLRPGNLITVAAETGRGKSSFARQIAMHVALKQHRGVHMWSGEMTKEEIIAAMTCTHAGVEAWRVTKDHLRDFELRQLSEAAGELSQAPIYIQDDNCSLRRWEARIRRTIAQLLARGEESLGCLIGDYLQLMDSGYRTMGEVERIGSAARNGKKMAQRLRLPLVLLSQLSRPDGGPPLSPMEMIRKLKGSSEIEQASNAIIILTANKTDMEANPPPKFVGYQASVVKQRSGPIGMKLMSFERAKTRFFEDAGQTELV